MSGKNLGGKTGRRGVLKRIGVIATAGVAAGTGVILTQRPGMAIAADSFSASDFSMSSNSGEIESLTLQPDLDYNWDGLDYQPKEITFTISVRTGGSGDYLEAGSETTTISSTALEGDGSYQFPSAINLLDSNGGPLSEDVFEPAKGNKGGGTVETTVGVQVEGALVSEDPDDSTNTNTYTDTKSDSYTVSVTNEAGNSNTGGQANPGGSMAGN